MKTLRLMTDGYKRGDEKESRKLALAIRKVLDGRTPLNDQWGRRLHHHSGLDEQKLSAIDKLLDNFGVESVTFECQRRNMYNCHDNGKPSGFQFSNTGDSYAWTVILYERRFYVMGWADMNEKHERRCRACKKLTFVGSR